MVRDQRIFRQRCGKVREQNPQTIEGRKGGKWEIYTPYRGSMFGRSGNGGELGWRQRKKGEEEKRGQQLGRQRALAQVRIGWAEGGPRISSHL